MTKKPVLQEVEFQNEIGQVIKPGDEVVIITSKSYSHGVRVNTGTYLGKKNNGVSCRVQQSHTKWRHKETGEDVGYYWGPDAVKRYGELPYPRANWTGLRYGTPEYDAERDRVNKEVAKYNEQYQNRLALYAPFKVPYFRHTTLQLNRIFKIDTPAADLRKI